MKKVFFLTLFIGAAVSLLLAATHRTYAQSAEDLKNVQDQIQQLQGQIQTLHEQQNTLKNKITVYNNQIELTTLEIEETELQIASLSGKIANLEDRLNHLFDVFRRRTVTSYQLTSQLDPLTTFLSSESFASFLERVKYLQAIQITDHQLMVQLEEVRSNYDDQKTIAELLSKKLEGQKVTLDQQKRESTYLLTKYQNDEKAYQKQLDQALAEQSAMEAAISQAVNLLTNGVHVDAGTPIAQIGNTGYPVCSTGTHLHFQVNKDGTPVDPAGYLKSESVIWDNSPDGPFNFTGNWDWPIENPRIEQGFGNTYWARLGWYRGGIHTGIDMISDTSQIIRTPVSGTLYKGVSSCGSVPIKFVAVDQGGGIILWFWHVQ